VPFLKKALQKASKLKTLVFFECCMEYCFHLAKKDVYPSSCHEAILQILCRLYVPLSLWVLRKLANATLLLFIHWLQVALLCCRGMRLGFFLIFIIVIFLFIIFIVTFVCSGFIFFLLHAHGKFLCFLLLNIV
jgi:hypothetical protein